MKLMRLDYRLPITRLPISRNGLDYRLRLPLITITDNDDSRLPIEKAAIRLAITISRGPLINTPGTAINQVIRTAINKAIG